MMIQKNFLEMLCCPLRKCRGNLFELCKDEKYVLVCENCKNEYPIIEGIPILYPNAQYAKDLHKRHWDQRYNAESYADKYDSYLKKQGTPWGQYTHESEISAIKKLTKNIDLAGKIILDCGSGNGRLLSCYPEAGKKVGIDTSLDLLLATKKREPNFWLVCGQLEDMPFKDAVADFSISIRVYQHLQAPEDAFSEMVRVTKPSGFVSLEVYNKLNLKELYKRFRMLKWVNNIKKWGLDYDRYYSYREIQKWCVHNFVTPIRYSGAGWGIHFYLLEPICFRRFAPKIIQKIVYGFFLRFEELVGTLPFFSKTLEKICFIGSVQADRKESTVKKIRSKLNKYFDLKRAQKYEKIIFDRNYALIEDDKKHLENAINWLTLAQDSSPDGGVSRGFSLVRHNKTNECGWQPSYPETTGYIIPTVLKANKMLKNDDLKRRAVLMGEWELSIMHNNGSVHGGNISSRSNSTVFDTGQVIRGLYELFLETGGKKYINTAVKSANWILSVEKDRQGCWIGNNAPCVNQKTTTYNIYAIAPIVRLGLDLGVDDFVRLGERVADYTISKQKENGWFEEADFFDSSNPLLHTLAYTIDGLWDMGELLNNNKYLSGAIKALDAVLSTMNQNGMLPGRINKDWKSSVGWSCLTGNAQIGILCIKVYKRTNEKKYLDSAIKIKNYLKTCQDNNRNNCQTYGGVWGSWPISGGYGKYEVLNWSTKYFADLLILLSNNH